MLLGNRHVQILLVRKHGTGPNRKSWPLSFKNDRWTYPLTLQPDLQDSITETHQQDECEVTLYKVIYYEGSENSRELETIQKIR